MLLISIQSGMLIALGFLAAMLLALLIAPAFWRRAVRLTTVRIKETMPVTDTEIRADKDRIRAEFAIRVHKLESEIEHIRLAEARQKIDLNRRDAMINELQGQLEVAKSSHEELTNARHVLEQTVGDRIPRLESLVQETKKLLFNRDREISDLRSRLQAAEARSKKSGSNRAPVLEAELEALKAQAQKQEALIADLRAAAADAGSQTDSGTPPEAAALQQELGALKALSEDQATEIARLKASIAVFEKQATDTRATEDGALLRSKIDALESEVKRREETIAVLKKELAAAEDNAAKQAEQLESQAAKLSAQGAARKALGERIAQSNDTSSDRPSNVEPLQRPALAAADASATKSLESASTGTEANRSEPNVAPKRVENENRPRLLDRISNLARQS